MNDVQMENHRRIRYAVSLLPKEIADAVGGYHIRNPDTVIEEIRLRKNREIALSVNENGRRVSPKLGQVVSVQALSDAVTGLCRGSVYSYSETIRNGYISCGMGIRAGVCGRAVVDGASVISVTDFSSLNIRIPNEITGAGRTAEELVRKFGGLLVCSAPGEGKTTVLRDLAVRLAGGVPYQPSLHVAVVDTRCELESYEQTSTGLELDLLSGYPRALGIDIAARTLAPDVIICDEISTESDAAAVLNAAASGIRTAASVHASSLHELRAKTAVMQLWETGAVNTLLFLHRRKMENILLDTVSNQCAAIFKDAHYHCQVVLSERLPPSAVAAYLMKYQMEVAAI